MPLKILLTLVVIACGVLSKLAPRVLLKINKRTPTDSQVMKFKFLMLFLILACAFIALVPRYI